MEDEHSSQTFQQPKNQLLTPVCCLGLFVMEKKKILAEKKKNKNQWINDTLDPSHEEERFIQALDFEEPNFFALPPDFHDPLPPWAPTKSCEVT